MHFVRHYDNSKETLCQYQSFFAEENIVKMHKKYSYFAKFSRFLRKFNHFSISRVFYL